MSEPVRPTRVDVGIPSYERPQHIGETIESVLAQTYEQWRLTISDDGPGEGAVEAAVDPYLGDPRINYVPTGTRIGQIPNWNRLLEVASGPYVAILHDDDRWHPGFLERRVSFLDQHPDCGFVFSGTNLIDERGRRLAEWEPGLDEGIYASESFARILARRNAVGAPVSVLARHSACVAVGPYFDGDVPHSDYEMWYRLALRFSVGYLAVQDADYRIHSNSTTHRERASAARVTHLAQRLEELADRERPGLLHRRDKRRLRANVLLEEISFNALGPGDRRYASDLLARALLANPAEAWDPRVLDWVRIMCGPRTRAWLAQKRQAFGADASARQKQLQ